MISGTRYRLTTEINRQTRLAAEIAHAHAQISTGKRLLAPSDDPVAAAQISVLGRTQAEEATWSRNLDVAGALAARSDTALTSVARGLDRANELMIAAATGTLSAENRATLAAELKGIALDLAGLADSRDARGEMLFRTDALEIPVYDGGTVTPVASRAALFESVSTAAGIRDIASILADAAAAIVEPVDSVRKAATDTSLTEVGAALAHIAAARGDQGVRASRIDALQERLAESKLQLEEQRSKLESTDITEAVTRLEAKDLSLKATQAVFARINQTSLFDILR
jgi:flagellar hook-associated protein 3 FlgL